MLWSLLFYYFACIVQHIYIYISSPKSNGYSSITGINIEVDWASNIIDIPTEEAQASTNVIYGNLPGILMQDKPKN